MEQSAFILWVAKYFPGVVLRVIEKLNGTTNPVTYLHRTMLREEFSPSGKWESINASYSNVMADYVAMDSPLPLKMRDSVGRASGDIPKMGIEMSLTESQLTELQLLVNQNQNSTYDSAIFAKLFRDTERCITAIYERNEMIFLMGLSAGETIADDDKNVGIGIRIDYKYPTANKFGVTELWTDATDARPIDDLKRAIKRAKSLGVRITTFMMDDATFGNFAASDQVRQLYGFSQNIVGGSVPVPSLEQVNAMGQKQTDKWSIQIVDRTMLFEKNGVRTTVTPWKAGMVIGITSTQVGALVYAPLAEEAFPVAGVTYQKAGSYILASKYRQNKPALAEVTNAQARVAPIVSDVDFIFSIDTTSLQG